MKRGGPLRRTTRLSPISKRRVAEKDAYRVVCEIVDRRDRGRCRLSGPTCWGPLDHHHVWPTGSGGPRLDPSNVILLCRGHHSWAHDHPADAREKGVLR